MKKTLLVIALAFGAFATMGQTPEIYVGGLELTGSGIGVSISPGVWHNGQFQPFETGGTLNDIFVSGGDVYAVGYLNNAAMMWINGVSHPIDIAGNYTTATGIYISNDNVYVCGMMAGFTGLDAVLLINDNPIGLPRDVSSALECSVNAVFVENDIAYIAGSTSINDIDTGGMYASLWIVENNNIYYHILPYRNSEANDIFVKDGEVYLFGVYKTNGYKPAFCKVLNATTETPQYETQIIEEEGDFDVFAGYVDGNNVYMVGGKDQNAEPGNDVMPKACLWSNGNMTFLADTTYASVAMDITVFNHIPYITGVVSQNVEDISCYQATLWENNQAQTLYNGLATKIFVTEENSLYSVLQNQVSVYPNPAIDKFYLEGIDYDYVKIYDLFGREVLSRGKDKEICIENLVKGIYNVRIFADGKVIGNNKLVKQ
ncbi:MAG: T9SS type A sorting domain-containing protein [Bacteroidales bacterium]|nr:T9SS type A sorting domain-containing protein [Bacteroidales bacterium]